MRRVIWTARAFEQLDTVYDYLMEKAPAHADKIIADTINVPNRLVSFPESGQIEQMLVSVGEFRYLVYSHYKLIYRIKGGDIFLVSVF